MTDQAWAFLTAVFIALFGAGGFFQWRRTSRKVLPATETANEAKEKISELLPIVVDLQRRLTDAEDAQMELLILLAAHNEWDLRVLYEIRKIDPEFPDPPPIKHEHKEID